MRLITNNQQRITFLLILSFFLTPLSFAVEFAGGTGRANDPYRIATPTQLLAIGSDRELLNKSFLLINDIDFYEAAGQRRSFRGSPVVAGLGETAFEGELDGGGYAIRGFRLSDHDEPQRLGLFGTIGKRGRVFNLVLDDGVIFGGEENAGLLAGYCAGTVVGCTVTGSVQGKDGLGLLVGHLEQGTLAYCFALGTVRGRNHTGGLVGSATGGQISYCHSYVLMDEAYSGREVGGLVGRMVQGTIEGCSATLDLSVASYTTVGGLVGYVEDTQIHACLAEGSVKGKKGVGGLVGRNQGWIQSCYATCDVDASDDNAGGLVGRNDGAVLLCYATGRVPSEIRRRLTPKPGKPIPPAALIGKSGGLIGDGYNALLSYWDLETSGVTQSAGGIGYNTTAMQRAQTYRGWGRDPVWKMQDGRDYPRLTWEFTPGTPLIDEPLARWQGRGTSADPYRITTADELVSLAWDVTALDKAFILMEDIDLSAVDPNLCRPIGVRGVPFCGSFEGRGHRISGFSYHQTSATEVGLFGGFGQHPLNAKVLGSLRDIHLENTGVTGAQYVGALVGYMTQGQIQGCHANGEIEGREAVGGLVGYLAEGVIESSSFSGYAGGDEYYIGGLVGWSSGQILGCFSAGSVRGEKSVGGLVGNVHGFPETGVLPLIAMSYSEAEVVGERSAGGLIGHLNRAEVFASYAAGKVSAHQDKGGLVGWASNYVSFSNVWDRQTTGLASSVMGQGLSETAMARALSFPGWGYQGRWTLDEGKDRPRLAWESRAGKLLRDTPRCYGGGKGTWAAPYRLETAEHLATLALYPDDFAKHFVLVNTINLTRSGYAVVPIGTSFVPFTGSFNGQGYAINGVRYQEPKEALVGLFRVLQPRTPGHTKRSGVVRNLWLTDTVMTGQDWVGGLVARHHGCIEQCGVAGRVLGEQWVGGVVGWTGLQAEVENTVADVILDGSGQQGFIHRAVGGLVGSNQGTVLLCTAFCTIEGSRTRPLQSIELGGLIGLNQTGAVVNSHAFGTLYGYSEGGGLIGRNLQGSVSRCYAAVDLDLLYTSGGLIGSSEGSEISISYTLGQVKGRLTGGFVGRSSGDVIVNCYTQGAVEGTSPGGFAGGLYDGTAVTDCYAVTAMTNNEPGGAFAYTINDDSQLLHCFWDQEVCPDWPGIHTDKTTSASIVQGLTTSELMQGHVLQQAGWDTHLLWRILPQTYPRLWWESFEER